MSGKGYDALPVRRTVAEAFIFKSIVNALKYLLSNKSGRGFSITRLDSLRPDVTTESKRDAINVEKLKDIISQQGKFTRIKKLATDVATKSERKQSIQKAGLKIATEILNDPDIISQEEGFDRIYTVGFTNTLMGMPPLMDQPSEPSVRRPVDVAEYKSISTRPLTVPTPLPAEEIRQVVEQREEKEPEVKEPEVKEPEVKEREEKVYPIVRRIEDLPEYKILEPQINTVLKQVYGDSKKPIVKLKKSEGKAQISLFNSALQQIYRPSYNSMIQSLYSGATVPEIASFITTLILLKKGVISGDTQIKLSSQISKAIFGLVGDSVYNSLFSLGYLSEGSVPLELKVEEVKLEEEKVTEEKEKEKEKQLEKEIEKQMIELEKEEKEKEERRLKRIVPPLIPPSQSTIEQNIERLITNPTSLAIINSALNSYSETGSIQDVVNSVTSAITTAGITTAIQNNEVLQQLTLNLMNRYGLPYNEEVVKQIKRITPTVFAEMFRPKTKEDTEVVRNVLKPEVASVTEKKISVDPKTLSETTFNLEQEGITNKLWEPKKISPTTDILSESKQEMYAQDLEYTAFDYIVPTSEGANGTVDTNPLKKLQNMNNEVRYNNSGINIPFLTWNQVNNANKMSQEQLTTMFLGHSLPVMEFVADDNADTFENVQNVHLANAENQSIEMFSPYSNFSNVENSWWSNPDSMLYTVNP